MSLLGRIGVAAAAFLAMASGANATVIAYGQPGFPAVGVTPSGFAAAYYSDSSNTDVGNQSPANVQSVLQGWFSTNLTFVGGGSCGTAPTVSNNCSAFTVGGGNSNKAGMSNLTAQIFAVHFGNRFLAFLYPAPVAGFQITGLRFGVSNIYAFNGPAEVPVPAAVWLMGAGLAGLGAASRKKKQA